MTTFFRVTERTHRTERIITVSIFVRVFLGDDAKNRGREITLLI
jgi:hypothetical protein